MLLHHEAITLLGGLAAGGSLLLTVGAVAVHRCWHQFKRFFTREQPNETTR